MVLAYQQVNVTVLEILQTVLVSAQQFQIQIMMVCGYLTQIGNPSQVGMKMEMAFVMS